MRRLAKRRSAVDVENVTLSPCFLSRATILINVSLRPERNGQYFPYSRLYGKYRKEEEKEQANNKKKKQRWGANNEQD
jgi:hypothetical protein